MHCLLRHVPQGLQASVRSLQEGWRLQVIVSRNREGYYADRKRRNGGGGSTAINTIQDVARYNYKEWCQEIEVQRLESGYSSRPDRVPTLGGGENCCFSIGAEPCYYSKESATIEDDECCVISVISFLIVKTEDLEFLRNRFVTRALTIFLSNLELLAPTTGEISTRILIKRGGWSVRVFKKDESIVKIINVSFICQLIV